MKAQVLDVSDEHANAALDKQLIAAVGFQPGVATQRFDQLPTNSWACARA